MEGKRIRRTYYLLLALFWLATALPMALGVLLMQARGIGLFQVGSLLGAYSLTIILLELPTGGLADAIGRKQVAVAAYGCQLLAGLILLFAFSWPVYLLAYVVAGVGRALSSGALEAWFVDALQAAEPDAPLQPALATAGSAALLALGAGTLLGSALPPLFSFLPADGTAVLTPLAVPLLLSLLLLALEIGLAIGLVREERPSTGGGQLAELGRGLRRVPALIGDAVALSRQNPAILRLMGASLAGGLALISLEGFWQPHFAALRAATPGAPGDSTLLFGVIMGGNFLLGAVGNLLSVPASRWLKERYGLVAALFQGLRGAFMIGLARQTAVLPAIALFWLVYLAFGAGNSPHQTLLNGQIPPQQRSAMLSLESLVGYVGALLGSVGLGYVAETWSTAVAWLIGGALLMVSLTLYLQVDQQRRHQERHLHDTPLCETG